MLVSVTGFSSSLTGAVNSSFSELSLGIFKVDFLNSCLGSSFGNRKELDSSTLLTSAAKEVAAAGISFCSALGSAFTSDGVLSLLFFLSLQMKIVLCPGL
jgi:hypothetical protein